MAQTCRRCGEVFEELVDGGCPGCGRAPAAAQGGTAAPRHPPPRVQASAGGRGAWGLIALAAVAALAGAGWLVYSKLTAKPPPPAPAVVKKKQTLKDWQAVVPPAKFIPALDALRTLAAKGDTAPLEDVVEDLRRSVAGWDQVEARIALVSALEGLSGKRAAPLLAVLALRLPMPLRLEDVEELPSLQNVTARAVLAFVDDANADVRQGAMACLLFLSDLHVTSDGRTFRALSPENVLAIREACHRRAKDERAETREAAAKALEFLEKK